MKKNPGNSVEEMKIEILTYGNPTLNQRSESVAAMTPEIQGLIDRMAEMMYSNKGVGLAATQIGHLVRVVVLDVDQVKSEIHPHPGRRLRVLVNPEILWESREDEPYVEGCLSIPGVDGKVFRPSLIRVRFRDLRFREKEMETGGLLARVIQHEVDHLNGILFVDRLGFTQRALIAGKLSKLRKEIRHKVSRDDVKEGRLVI
jgi:peptide deformylase